MRASAVIVAVTVTFTLLGLTAVAAGPTSASGTFVATQTVTSVRTADGNTFLTTQDSEVVTGTNNGTIVGQSELVIHADGNANVHGEFVCICTIPGQGSGTLTFKYTGTIRGGVFEGQYRIVDSSGGLAGTHGLGRFRAVGGVGTYSGSQHYGP